MLRKNESAESAYSLKTIAIIPVFKNIPEVLKVLAKFRGEVDEICIVVDSATKSEIDEFRMNISRVRTPTRIISHQERKGIGYAIRASIKYALDNSFEVAVVMAGNNKDDPAEIPRLLEPILKRGFEYVQGSRFIQGGKHVRNPFLRRIFSRLYPFLWTLITHFRCTDVTNGFRAYKLKILLDKRINIWQDWLDGYQLEYYIHYKVITLGYKIIEVPVSKVYPYRNHKGGYTKISPFQNWWHIVGPLIYLSLGVRK